MKNQINTILCLALIGTIAVGCSLKGDKKKKTAKRGAQEVGETIDYGPPTVGVMNQSQVKEAMSKITGISPNLPAIRLAYEASAANLSGTGGGEGFTEGNFSAYTSLAVKYCQEWMKAEEALPPEQRKVFKGVNSGQGPAQLSDSTREGVIQNLSQAVLLREATPEEVTEYKSCMSGIQNDPLAKTNRSPAQQVQDILVCPCAVTLSRLEFLQS